jgi:hypothetical protein
MIVPVSAYGNFIPGFPLSPDVQQRITIVNNTGRTLIFQSSDHSHGSWGCHWAIGTTSRDPPQQIPPGGTVTVCSSTSSFGFFTGTAGEVVYAARDCDGSLSLFRISWSRPTVGDNEYRIDNVSHDSRYQVRHSTRDQGDTETYVISGGPAGPCPLRPGQVQPVPASPTCIRMVNGVCEVQPAGPPSSSVQGRPPDSSSNRTAGVFGRPDTLPAPPLPPPGLSSQERRGYDDGCNQARTDSTRHSMYNPMAPNTSTKTSSGQEAYRSGYRTGYITCWLGPAPTMSSGGGSRPSGMTVENKNNTEFPLQSAGLNGTSGPGSRSKPCIIDAMTGATICNSLTNSTVPFASINSSTASDLTGTSGGGESGGSSSGSNDHHQSQHPAATRSSETGGSGGGGGDNSGGCKGCGSGGNGGSDNGGKGSGSGDIKPGGK